MNTQDLITMTHEEEVALASLIVRLPISSLFDAMEIALKPLGLSEESREKLAASMIKDAAPAIAKLNRKHRILT